MRILSVISEAVQDYNRYERSANAYAALVLDNPTVPRMELLEQAAMMTGTQAKVIARKVNEMIDAGDLSAIFRITSSNLFEASEEGGGGGWQDGSNNPTGFATAEPYSHKPKDKKKKKKGGEDDDGEEHDAHDKHVFKADSSGRNYGKDKDEGDEETSEDEGDGKSKNPFAKKDKAEGDGEKKPNPFGGKDKGDGDGDEGPNPTSKDDGDGDEEKPSGKKMPSFKKAKFGKSKDEDGDGDNEDDDVEEKGSRTNDASVFAQGDERDAQGKESEKSQKDDSKDDMPIGKTVVLINPKEKDDFESDDEDDPSNKKLARKK